MNTMTTIDLAAAMKAAAARDMAAYRKAWGNPVETRNFGACPIPPISRHILRYAALHDPEPVVVDQAMATALGVATQSLSNAIRVLEPRGYLDVQRVGKGTKAPRRIRITAAGRAFLATVGA